MKLDITIYICDKKNLLNTSQTDDYNGIKKKTKYVNINI